MQTLLDCIKHVLQFEIWQSDEKAEISKNETINKFIYMSNWILLLFSYFNLSNVENSQIPSVRVDW